MGAAENLDLTGKDWLNVAEAAFYCGVSESQFRKNAIAYGLTPRRFMGKQLYEKAALYAAIHRSQEWQGSPSIGAATRPISTGSRAGSDIAHRSASSANEKLRKYGLRKKLS